MMMGRLFLTLLALVSVVFGGINCFLGQRLLKTVMSVQGFFLGMWLGILLAGARITPANTYLVGLVGGIVGAALMIFLWYKVRLFLFGASTGGFLLYAYYLFLHRMVAPTDLICVVAVIAGVAILAYERQVTVGLTAFSGAMFLLLSGGIIFFDGLRRYFALHTDAEHVVMGIWLLLAIAGMLVQKFLLKKPSVARLVGAGERLPGE